MTVGTRTTQCNFVSMTEPIFSIFSNYLEEEEEEAAL